MNKTIKRSLGRKVRLGRLAMPLWAMALAVLVVAGAAGQAVGPVLAGSVQGNIALTAQQALRLNPNSDGNVVTGADQFVITTNDEGTAFTAAIETKVGQNQILKLDLDNTPINQSGQVDGVGDGKINGILELSVPAGIDVAVRGASYIAACGTGKCLSQLSKNSWLFRLKTGGIQETQPDILITIEPKDDAAPGFYTIGGRIIQVSN